MDVGCLLGVGCWWLVVPLRSEDLVLPADRSFLLLTLRSGSMAPLLPAGCRVRAVPDPLRPFRSGVVACFKAGRDLMVPRLLQEIRIGRRRWFVHRGDASREPGLLGEKDLIGRVVEVERDGAWIPLAEVDRAPVKGRAGAVARIAVKILRNRLRKTTNKK